MGKLRFEELHNVLLARYCNYQIKENEMGGA